MNSYVARVVLQFFNVNTLFWRNYVIYATLFTCPHQYCSTFVRPLTTHMLVFRCTPPYSFSTSTTTTHNTPNHIVPCHRGATCKMNIPQNCMKKGRSTPTIWTLVASLPVQSDISANLYQTKQKKNHAKSHCKTL